MKVIYMVMQPVKINDVLFLRPGGSGVVPRLGYAVPMTWLCSYSTSYSTPSGQISDSQHFQNHPQSQVTRHRLALNSSHRSQPSRASQRTRVPHLRCRNSLFVDTHFHRTFPNLPSLSARVMGVAQYRLEPQ